MKNKKKRKFEKAEIIFVSITYCLFCGYQIKKVLCGQKGQCPNCNSLYPRGSCYD